MPEKEATARIKINKLLEAAGWRFFSEGNQPANIRLEPSITIKSTDLETLGDNFEKTGKGFIDFLLLDAKGFPLIVLEAKAENKNPLVGKEQARKYARSQNCRFVILSNGNLHYNLSGERYGEQTRLLQAKWPTVTLGEICTFMTGGTPTSTVAEYYENSTVPWLVSGDIHQFEIWDCEQRITVKAVENSNARVLPKDSVLIALNGQGKTRGTVALLRMDNATCNQSLVAITPAKPPRVISEFIFWMLRSMYSDIRALTGDAERSGLNISILKSIQIPLPPLEVQKEIVAEIEGYQKVIDGAHAVLDNYRPHIPIHPNWPMVPLGEIADVQLGKMLDQAKHQKGKLLPYARNVSVRWGMIDTHDLPEMYFEEDELERFELRAGDVLVCEGGEPGRAAVWDGGIPNLKYQKALHRVRFKVPFEPSMLVYLLQEMALSGALIGWLSGTTIKHLTLESFNKLPIPLPPLVTQQAIVAEIEAEQALVNANRELIARFEKKIQATLARVWGEDEPTTAEA